MNDEITSRIIKRYEWLHQLGKSERDISKDEEGDEFVCLKTEDHRCTEVRYLPDGLQHLNPSHTPH